MNVEATLRELAAKADEIMARDGKFPYVIIVQTGNTQATATSIPCNVCLVRMFAEAINHCAQHDETAAAEPHEGSVH